MNLEFADPASVLPREFEPFVKAGLIKTAFIGDLRRNHSFVQESDNGGHDIETSHVGIGRISEYPTEALRNSLVLISDSELERVAKIFDEAGLPKIPFLYVENTSRIDIVKLVSDAAFYAERHIVVDYDMGYRKAGLHSQYDVSVVIPVYKIADYIERCAVSLLNQKFAGRFEILFVDDGSPDRSVEILKDTIAGHDNFRIISKENGGAASARNVGLDFAQGTYVGFVDGDDYVSDEYLDTLFRAAILNDCDISQASFAYENEATGKIDIHKEYFGTSAGKIMPEAKPSFYMMRQVPGIWRRLYKRQMLRANSIRFVEEFKQHDDLAFNIEVLSQDASIAISRECVYFYRIERAGQSVAASDRRLFVHFDIFDYLLGKLAPKLWEMEYYKTFFATMFSHHLWVYEKISDDLKNEYLKRVAVQMFKSNGPIGAIDRALFLSRHFRRHRPVIARAALLSLRS